MINYRINFLFITTSILFLCSCAPIVDVSIDSINNNTTLWNKKCVILPGQKYSSTSDVLLFNEFYSYLARALTCKGYEVINDVAKASQVIFLSYGIGDPEKHYYSYSVPIWGQTGISSSTTHGTANTFGDIYSLGNNSSFSGTTLYSSTTEYTPTYGIIGSTSHIGSFVTYTRYISLHAYDLRSFHKTKQIKIIPLWKTDIMSTGSDGDLREIFPVLIAAATPYIGENTGRKIQVKMCVDSKEVLAIKGLSE